MIEFLRIPQKRVGVLVGKNGKNKARIEKELHCTLKISKDGDVEIDANDPLNALKAKDVVKAIGRGFSIGDALFLLDDAYALEVISLRDVFGKNERQIRRMKARIIGSDGRIKKKLEEITNTKIVVFGSTVSIIGLHSDVRLAREAVDMILDGKMHSTVLSFLERKKSIT